MTPPQGLVPSNSNVLREYQRVVEQLLKLPASSKDRLPLLRRQAALGDLRDEIDRRARRAANAG